LRDLPAERLSRLRCLAIVFSTERETSDHLIEVTWKCALTHTCMHS